jgi:hypothetical protein
MDMDTNLNGLIERAKLVDMTIAQVREQRQSFVYGNTHIENSMITREMVVEVDEKISGELKADER